LRAALPLRSSFPDRSRPSVLVMDHLRVIPCAVCARARRCCAVYLRPARVRTGKRGAFMRIVLADLASADGFVSKDTVVGGYGSRLRPFSRVTGLVCSMKRRRHALPSVQLGYIASILAAAGHEVVYTEGAPADGDVALVLTSL